MRSERVGRKRGAPRAREATVQRVVIALGSNVGARRAQIVAAWRAVCRRLALQAPALSAPRWSEPAEAARGAAFANAVGVGYTRCAALEALAGLQAVEAALGRDRGREGHHGPRRIDLDLIDWGGERWHDPALTLPHPRLHQRDFVLAPLAEVAPGWRCPCCGASPEALLRSLPRRHLLAPTAAAAASRVGRASGRGAPCGA
jgi:2-amino-4-hydroxy-6-hydroxymethyldihydropteridine diphosphokinase